MLIFNKIGVILNGKTKGWNITIQDDTEGETGGYYILEWSSEDDNKGFDNWYENIENLLFNLTGREIDWTNQDYIPRQPTVEQKKKTEEFRVLAKKKGF